MAQSNRVKYGWAGVAGLVCLLALGFWFAISRQASLPVPLEKIIIALPTQPSTAPMFVALEQGLFKKHGLEVINQVHEIGAQGLKSVLDSKADLVVVADTPFMFKVMNGEKIAIVATIANSRRAAALVARRDRGISGVGDLAGKKIGVALGTNMQFMLDSLLLADEVPGTAVTIINLKPDDMVGALQAGQVDAVVAWHPYLATLQQSMGGKIIVLYGEDLFSYRFNLVGRQDYIANHPATLQKVVAALAEAEQFIGRDPAAARTIVGKYTNMDQATLTQVFDPNDFELKLDQSLLLSLDDQTRWAIKHGLVKGKQVPNYLDFIYFDALQTVRSAAITIIH